MKTIEDYLNEVSKEVNYDSFAQMISLRTQYGSIDTTVKLISESVKEATIRYAKQCCDELQKTDWTELLLDGSNQPDETGKYFVVIKGKSDVATYIKQYKGWIASGQYYSDNFRNIGITHYSMFKMPNTPNVVNK